MYLYMSAKRLRDDRRNNNKVLTGKWHEKLLRLNTRNLRRLPSQKEEKLYEHKKANPQEMRIKLCFLFTRR